MLVDFLIRFFFECLKAFIDNKQFIGKTIDRKSGYMKVNTEGTLPGLNPLASSLACIFFFDENTYFNVDNIDVEGKAYNFVKLIQGNDFTTYFEDAIIRYNQFELSHIFHEPLNHVKHAGAD